MDDSRRIGRHLHSVQNFILLIILSQHTEGSRRKVQFTAYLVYSTERFSHRIETIIALCFFFVRSEFIDDASMPLIMQAVRASDHCTYMCTSSVFNLSIRLQNKYDRS